MGEDSFNAFREGFKKTHNKNVLKEWHPLTTKKAFFLSEANDVFDILYTLREVFKDTFKKKSVHSPRSFLILKDGYSISKDICVPSRKKCGRIKGKKQKGSQQFLISLFSYTQKFLNVSNWPGLCQIIISNVKEGWKTSIWYWVLLLSNAKIVIV